MFLQQQCSTVTNYFENCCSGLHQPGACHRQWGSPRALASPPKRCDALPYCTRPAQNLLLFPQIPATCKRQWTKEPCNISQSKFKALHMYMHTYVYIHMHIYIKMHLFTFTYTCKHTTRPHPNIFTSKLICHVIDMENIKKWMVFLSTNKTRS